MLTLFTVPKPFSGHIAVIQKNAIQSWARLGQGCRIVLCADEKGTRELAEMVGAIYLPEIERNSFGTPLLSSVFAKVARLTEHPLLCYLNADIIVFPDLLDAVRRIPWVNFLLIGRRTNVDITEPLCFHRPGWAQQLRDWARTTGKLAPASGIDYMVFSASSVLRTLPPFAVGRPCWDNWFVDRALRCGLPVVDATSVVLALHQNHGYGHVPQAQGVAWEGPEADRNRSLADLQDRIATIEDADYHLGHWLLRRRWHVKRKLRRVREALKYLARLVQRWRRKVRLGVLLLRRNPAVRWPYCLGRLRARPLLLLSALRVPGTTPNYGRLVIPMTRNASVAETSEQSKTVRPIRRTA
jgi:hypothetical protein